MEINFNTSEKLDVNPKNNYKKEIQILKIDKTINISKISLKANYLNEKKRSIKII